MEFGRPVVMITLVPSLTLWFLTHHSNRCIHRRWTLGLEFVYELLRPLRDSRMHRPETMQKQEDETGRVLVQFRPKLLKWRSSQFQTTQVGCTLYFTLLCSALHSALDKVYHQLESNKNWQESSDLELLDRLYKTSDDHRSSQERVPRKMASTSSQDVPTQPVIGIIGMGDVSLSL